MNISETDIATYIKEHEDIYTCTIDGQKYVLYAKDNHTLVVQGLPGYFRNLRMNKAKFIPESIVEPVEVDAVFPQSLIDGIKADTLDLMIRCNLERLLPAAKAMIKHYNEPVDSTVAHFPAHIRMYVLKDIDFIQPGKGVVVICPTSDGVTHERDFIKGYVYCGEHDSIKFETVQGWRYRKLGFDSIVCRRYNLEWSELMSAK